MRPARVSRTGLPAVATVHQNSTLVSLFVIRAVVNILNTSALEQQHSHHITLSFFNLSVLLVTVDIRRVLNIDDVSTPRVSSHHECNVSPCRSSLVSGLVTLALQVHYCSCIRSSFFILNRLSISIANFSMLTVALKLLTANAIGSLPKVNSHCMASVCRLILSCSNDFVHMSALLSLLLML